MAAVTVIGVVDVDSLTLLLVIPKKGAYRKRELIELTFRKSKKQN